MCFGHARRAVEARLHHPGYWAVGAALLLFTIPGLRFHARNVLYEVLLVAFIALWGFAQLFLCPAPWQWSGDDRPHAGFLRGCGQALLLSLLASALLPLLRLLPGAPPALPEPPILVGTAFGLTLLLLPVGFFLARAEHQADETRRSLARARDIEWMSHRGAFSPSLLLGNLGHLADLAGTDARATEQGLVDLAALYRQWLVDAEKPRVPWRDERTLAEDYLDLEARRWEGRLRYRWDLDPAADEVPVPPLVLMPLLEAALALGPGGGEVTLEAGARQLPSGLEIRLRATTPAPPPEAGIGRAVEDRGGRGCLVVEPGDGRWEARVHLPGPGGGQEA